MQKSENIAELSQEEIERLKAQRFSGGCLIPSIVILIIAAIVSLYLLRGMFSLKSMEFWIFGGIAVIIFALIAYFFAKYVKGINEPLERDIYGGRKKVIIAPIESKRTDSVEHKDGPKRGQMTMSYFMTVNGKEYVMSEEDYLQIRSGEFMEIHTAPASNFVLSQKWLKAE